MPSSTSASSSAVSTPTAIAPSCSTVEPLARADALLVVARPELVAADRDAVAVRARRRPRAAGAAPSGTALPSRLPTARKFGTSSIVTISAASSTTRTRLHVQLGRDLGGVVLERARAARRAPRRRPPPAAGAASRPAGRPSPAPPGRAGSRSASPRSPPPARGRRARRPATGQPARWTDAGASGQLVADERLPQLLGQERHHRRRSGARSGRGRTRASGTRPACRRRRSLFQKRAREPRMYQFERSSTNASTLARERRRRVAVERLRAARRRRPGRAPRSSGRAASPPAGPSRGRRRWARSRRSRRTGRRSGTSSTASAGGACTSVAGP